ncbi:MAG: MarR family transcriptional regulator [Chloroflexi bacterium]|nr:MarR family transcriptional regulator [Chloroflexota bacterium]
MTESTEAEGLGHLLWRIIKLHRIHAHTVLDQLGLYRGQHFVLAALWEQEGLTQSELAERTMVRPATMTASLQRMEAAGLIERRPDPHDQRVMRVYLTEAGRALKESVNAAWRALEERTFEGFTPQEQEQLRCFMLHIIANLERETENIDVRKI